MSMVLNHLKTFGSITVIQAQELYGCYRLGARIWDLRHLKGVAIRTEMVEIPGKDLRCARYVLDRR